MASRVVESFFRPRTAARAGLRLRAARSFLRILPPGPFLGRRRGRFPASAASFRATGEARIEPVRGPPQPSIAPAGVGTARPSVLRRKQTASQRRCRGVPTTDALSSTRAASMRDRPGRPGCRGRPCGCAPRSPRRAPPVPFTDGQLHDHPLDRGGHLRDHLVRLHDGQGLALLHVLARRDLQLDDGPLGEAFTDVGEAELEQRRLTAHRPAPSSLPRARCSAVMR